VVRDQYPLPLLHEILQALKLQTAQFFMVLGVHWGFNNIWIRKSDEWKATFITNRSLFEPQVMYFSMCNAPASFQRMMDILFTKVLTTGNVFVYVDDVLVARDDLEELRYWTREVLEIMRASHLSCKPIKCQFEQRTVQYLRMIIGHGQTAINPKKAAAITEWLVPETLKQVQSFLDTCNFWQKFIHGFSTITWPLHDLVKKTIPFEWTEERQQAFDALKHAITLAPVLKTLREDLPYLIEMDTSGVALGAVLSQQHDGHWHLVDFHSRSLKPAKQNYPAHDAELLAIIDSLKVWRHLLEGAKHDTIICTDNMVLKYFMLLHLLSH
jgi:hypothetical protein